MIVGAVDPRFRDPLPSLITDLGLLSRVRLLPDVPDEWLPAVYRAASVFAFPSLAEGYGLPVLEAMAAGVPVVASDIPALAEVAGSGALLVPPRDVAGWASALAAVPSPTRRPPPAGPGRPRPSRPVSPGTVAPPSYASCWPPWPPGTRCPPPCRRPQRADRGRRPAAY